MICHTCKTENRPNARFCRGCGATTMAAIPMPILGGLPAIPARLPGPTLAPPAVPAAPLMQQNMMVPPQPPAIVVSPPQVIVLTPSQPAPPLPQPQPIPIDASNSCPQCRARRRQTDWHCGQCGFKLPVSNARLCLQCGCALCNNQRFCHSCGGAVAAARCG